MAKVQVQKKQKPPSRAKVDRELYEQILIFYVGNGLKHMEAVKRFGLSRRTLTGLYYEGADHLGLPPMKTLVTTVEWKARALRASMREDELAQAENEIEKIINGTSASVLAKTVDDAAQARAEEGAIVQAARKNILSLQAMLSPLLGGAKRRLKDLERLVEREELDVWDMLKLMRELAKLQNDLSAAAKVNFEMERMLMGEVPETDAAPMGKSDAVRVLEIGARTLNRLRAQGRIVEGEGVEVVRLDTLPPSEFGPDDEEFGDKPEQEEAFEDSGEYLADDESPLP